jgi:hypothetical protein
MADKQPTFAERTKQMRENATGLLKMAEAIEGIANALHAEADRMAAAEKRFAERNAQRKSKADR